MYRIYLKSDNEFLCECTIQDGTERWKATSMREAVVDMKQAAMCFNHAKINKNDIKVYKPRQVYSTEWEQIG